MKFELYKDVVLALDLPEHRLKRGDIVKLVEHHFGTGGTEGYSAEVFNALGHTLTVITVPVVVEVVTVGVTVVAYPLMRN